MSTPVSRIFFKIGADYDLTPYLDIQNFDINQEEVVQEWVDGSYATHRVFLRKRIQGKVRVGFANETDYNNFLSNMASLKTTTGVYYGSYSVTSFVNNMTSMTVEASYTAYIKFLGTAKWDLINGRQWLVQELEVLEV